MSALKLTTAASIYGNPYKWARTLATTPHPPTTITTITYTSLSHSSPFLALNCSSNSQRISLSSRITQLSASSRNLGFLVHKSFSSSASPSSLSTSKSSSEGKGGERELSESDSGGGVVADNINNNMGSEDKDDWSHNHYHRLQPSLQSQQSHSQQQLQHQQSSKLLTLPTILTLGRVAAVPLLVITFYMNSRWGTTATTSIFIVAAITDWLDGYIARKMRLGTAFGAFLDPVADKLMVAATLVLLCTRPLNVGVFGEVPWLLTIPAIAIIGREITMSAVREWAASQNSKLSEAVAVNNLGKWKTASQMIALTILLATRDSSLVGSWVLVVSGVVLLYISAGLALWSLVVYMRKIGKVLLK